MVYLTFSWLSNRYFINVCRHPRLLLLLLLSRFSRVWLCATPEMAAHQAPLSLRFSRQEHWSGLPFPSPMHESEKWKGSCSVMSDSQRPHGPPSMGFSRQECWSGVPLPSPHPRLGCHKCGRGCVLTTCSTSIWHIVYLFPPLCLPQWVSVLICETKRSDLKWKWVLIIYHIGGHWL